VNVALVRRALEPVSVAAVAFEIGFSLVTALLVTDPLGRYGAPFPIGYGPSWLALGGGTFDPLAVIADLVLTAAVFAASWALAGNRGVAAAALTAAGAVIAAIGADLAGWSLPVPFLYPSPLAPHHLELGAMWFGAMALGIAVATSLRVAGRPIRSTGR
jgi:hypothetical protein